MEITGRGLVNAHIKSKCTSGLTWMYATHIHWSSCREFLFWSRHSDWIQLLMVFMVKNPAFKLFFEIIDICSDRHTHTFWGVQAGSSSKPVVTIHIVCCVFWNRRTLYFCPFYYSALICKKGKTMETLLFLIELTRARAVLLTVL